LVRAAAAVDGDAWLGPSAAEDLTADRTALTFPDPSRRADFCADSGSDLAAERLVDLAERNSVDPQLERELTEAGNRLIGIDIEMLGVLDDAGPDVDAATRRQVRMLAGCLWGASIAIVDRLFEDLSELIELGDGVDADAIKNLQVLGALPPRFAHHFDVGFARHLLVAAVDLTARFTQGWQPPSCVAQELLLQVLLDEVAYSQELLEIDLHPDWRDTLDELLFEDLDFEVLFDPSLDGIEDEPTLGPPGMVPMDFAHWFVPFRADDRLPPFADQVAPSGVGVE